MPPPGWPTQGALVWGVGCIQTWLETPLPMVLGCAKEGVGGTGGGAYWGQALSLGPGEAV